MWIREMDFSVKIQKHNSKLKIQIVLHQAVAHMNIRTDLRMVRSRYPLTKKSLQKWYFYMPKCVWLYKVLWAKSASGHLESMWYVYKLNVQGNI